MFGNLKGWIIAAVLGGLLAMLTWQAIAFNAITPRTAMSSRAELFQPLVLGVDPATLVTMDAAGDGSSLYREAIKMVKASKPRYEAYLEKTTTLIDDVPAVQKLIDAAPLQPGPILTADLSANIGYVMETDDLVALKLAGDCCERLGVLNMADNPEVAKKCFRAELALGAKMFDERLYFYEAFDAIGLMHGAAGGLKVIATRAKDDGEVEKLTDFVAGTDKAAKLMDDMWKVVGAIDLGTVALHAGDVFYFTYPQMNERMWRIQSTLQLGRLKYSAARLADSSAVDRRLVEMSKTEKDPAVLAAVSTAQALTMSDYRSIVTQRQ